MSPSASGLPWRFASILPSSMRCTHIEHFSITPRVRTVTSGLSAKILQRVVVLVLEPVESADLVGTVVRAIPSADAAVVRLLVESLFDHGPWPAPGRRFRRGRCRSAGTSSADVTRRRRPRCRCLVLRQTFVRCTVCFQRRSATRGQPREREWRRFLAAARCRLEGLSSTQPVFGEHPARLPDQKGR